MLTIRQTHTRGLSQSNWLSSFYTFSFANYYDPEIMGFGKLRVLNEDTVQPGQGFGLHAHKNMEILSYVVKGTLEHKDSMGNSSIIQPGEIQCISAGTGMQHSEFNHSNSDTLHFLQIWIIPEENSLPPSYQQKTIPPFVNQFILIGSREGSDTAIKIHQDIELYVAYLDDSTNITYEFKPNRSGWLQIINGSIMLNGKPVLTGDGVMIQDETNLSIQCMEKTELLLFNLNNS